MPLSLPSVRVINKKLNSSQRYKLYLINNQPDCEYTINNIQLENQNFKD